MSSENGLLTGAGGIGRTVAKGRSRLGGGGSSESCDWAVAAYEEASGAVWPALADEERPSVRPMTGSTTQRSWRHICLLVRGSIELDSLSATQAGVPGARPCTPLSQDAANVGATSIEFLSGEAAAHHFRDRDGAEVAVRFRRGHPVTSSLPLLVLQARQADTMLSTV